MHRDRLRQIQQEAQQVQDNLTFATSDGENALQQQRQLVAAANEEVCSCACETHGGLTCHHGHSDTLAKAKSRQHAL